MDVGCYCVNSIRTFFAEEPVSVFGHAEYGKRTGIDLSFAGTLIFSEGKLGIFSSSFQTTLDRRVEIIGTQGRILVPSPWKPDGKLSSFTIEINGRPKLVETHNGGEIYLNETDHFSRCVLARRTPLLTSSDGLRNMVVIDALKKSAKTGKEIRLTAERSQRAGYEVND
jgi:predicted dehydrogenase